MISSITEYIDKNSIYASSITMACFIIDIHGIKCCCLGVNADSK